MLAPRLAQLGHAATALAAAAGAYLFGCGLADQLWRLALLRLHGLGFKDPFCTTGYCDYPMFWLAGLFSRHGHTAWLYDYPHYAALAARILPYKTGWWPFIYPPSMLLPATLIAALPLAAGYYLISALSLATSAWLLRRAGVPGWCIALGLASPAAMWNLYLGQFGLLCGALLIFGLARLQTRPASAGAALSWLIIKPQYALLVPVAVLASRNWRAMGAGTCGLALLLGLSCLLGGGAGWAAYLGPGRAAMRLLLNQPFSPGGYMAMGDSVFWTLRSLHAALPLAYAGQGLASLACALAAWRLWQRQAPHRIMATLCLAMLASPYGFTDDLATLSALLPMLAARRTPWRNAALAWLWVAPTCIPKFVALTGTLPTPLLPLAALALCLTPAPALKPGIQTDKLQE